MMMIWPYWTDTPPTPTVRVGRKAGKSRVVPPNSQIRKPWMLSRRPTVATREISVRAPARYRASQAMTYPARMPTPATATTRATGQGMPWVVRNS